MYAYVGNDPVNEIDPFGLRNVDVYVWNAAGASVGHVMITEHDSQQVILSQFPAMSSPSSYNITLNYQETMKSEGRAPSNIFVVDVPNDQAFNDAAAWERAKKEWNWDPTTKQQTQCSTSSWNSLAAGGVPIGTVSGTTFPSTLGKALKKFLGLN